MNLQDQAEADRQVQLCDQRQKLIEAGQLRSCQPLPPPLLPRPDDCPNCGHKMQWLVARHGWFCFKPSCQIAMQQPIETFHI